MKNAGESGYKWLAALAARLGGGRSANELLSAAGFRIEGPGQCEIGGKLDRFWWTLGREGWSGYETSAEDFGSEQEAYENAAQALRSDEEIDWKSGIVGEPQQFPTWFVEMVRDSCKAGALS